MTDARRVPLPTAAAPERELLVKLAAVLAPLGATIDHSLHVGTVEQMRGDLSYLRGLIGAAHAVIEDTLRV